ncbi:hypothetical protein [Flammeovirga agarivorans]|uniref:Uncharacterized protein n=1 Tax=Flammeovirga agarivorans TaxID=2726742 RepID=A0A7X8XZ81_9BACT|nr:hypothetical protein [Flammeovirga agarivorans]NLR94907.1 hypothetical protein [Flammeovirga agarivorans]
MLKQEIIDKIREHRGCDYHTALAEVDVFYDVVESKVTDLTEKLEGDGLKSLIEKAVKEMDEEKVKPFLKLHDYFNKVESIFDCYVAKKKTKKVNEKFQRDMWELLWHARYDMNYFYDNIQEVLEEFEEFVEVYKPKQD